MRGIVNGIEGNFNVRWFRWYILLITGSMCKHVVICFACLEYSDKSSLLLDIWNKMAVFYCTLFVKLMALDRSLMRNGFDTCFEWLVGLVN